MTQPLRLDDLVPEEVAASIVEAARAVMLAFSEQLAPGVEWVERKKVHPERARLAVSVATLVRYAKEGGNHDEAQELVRDLSAALHRRVVDSEEARAEPGEELEVTTPIGLALAAASARVLLATNRPVGAPQLAILANVDASAIRRLVAAGELEAERLPPKLGGAQIRAAVARRWLAQRGVPGFAKP